GQRAWHAPAGDGLIGPAEPGAGDGSQPVESEERRLPAQQVGSGWQDDVLVEQPADREDGEDAQDRPSSSTPDRLEDVPLEPSVDPHVVPAPEVEDRVSQDGVAEGIGDAV